jgi:tetratricopeptide (TPR) repeat protein
MKLSAEEIERRIAGGRVPLEPEFARAVRDLAASHLLTDPSRSLHLASSLLEAIPPDASPPAAFLAHAWRAEAEALLFTGRTAESRKAYERAISEARAAGEEALEGQILVGAVHVFALLGDREGAARLSRRAQRLLRRAGDLVYLGKLHMNEGNAHYQEDRYPEAAAAYGRAARLLARAGAKDATWVSLLVNRAVALTNLSRIAEARRLFLEAERHAEAMGLASLGAQARFNRAHLEALRGDYRTALSLLRASGEVFRQQGVRHLLASTLRTRAEIYLELGMPAQARELAQEAAEVFEAEGMRLDAILSRLDLAEARLGLGEREAGMAILREAAEHFREAGNARRQALVLQRLAQVSLGEGDPEGIAPEAVRRALRIARDAARRLQALGMPRAEAAARRLEAAALLALGRAAGAERILETLRPKLASLPVGERMEWWALAGRVAWARGDARRARTRLERAAALLERQRRMIPGAGLRRHWFRRHVRVYHDLLALALEGRPRLRRLFRLVEAARARAFRDRLLQARQPLRLARRRAELGALLKEMQEAEVEGRHTRVQRILDRIRRLEEEIFALVLRSQEAARSLGEWVGTDPETVAARLRRDEALLSFFVLDDRVLAFVLRRDRASWRILPRPAADVREAWERLRLQIDAAALLSGATPRGAPGSERPGPSPMMEAAALAALRDLHAALIEPLAEEISGARRLLLVPHGFLHHVPFEALRSEEGWLLDRVLVSRLPAADHLLRRPRRDRARPPRGTGTQGSVVAGTPTGGPAAVQTEIRRVARQLPGARVLEDPSAEELLEALGRCRVAHLATHGEFRPDNPLFSSLRTRDGALFVADLAQVRLRTDLLFLGACQTGRTFTGPGEDLEGVAHAFLAAGVRTLVATLWRVHDEATLELVTRFYAAWRDGTQGDAAQALALAARGMRERWPHPFFWGGFAVFGTP